MVLLQLKPNYKCCFLTNYKLNTLTRRRKLVLLDKIFWNQNQMMQKPCFCGICVIKSIYFRISITFYVYCGLWLYAPCVIQSIRHTSSLVTLCCLILFDDVIFLEFFIKVLSKGFISWKRHMLFDKLPNRF